MRVFPLIWRLNFVLFVNDASRRLCAFVVPEVER